MSRYDGLEVLENSSKYGGYMSITNYSFAFMYRVANAGIVSLERMAVAMDMLTFKHGEERPHTSQDTFANRFGCSVKSIKAAVKDLKTSGLINIFKKGRSNSYDLSPLLKCLASFVEHVHAGKEFCINRLIEDVLSGVYVPERVQEEEQPAEPVFDEVITAALDTLSEADRKAAIPIIEEHGNKMSSESVVHYIEGAIGKERFGGYLNKCMEGGSDEQVKQQQDAAAKPKPQPKQNFGKKPVRNEPNVDWLQKRKEEDEAKQEQYILFTKTYGKYTQDLYKEVHNEEAFKHQGSFITWFKEEVKNHEGNTETFDNWCYKEQHRKLLEHLGRKHA
ncbi:hypothetical protein CN613_25630 [Bacillus pseudomycoides]|uniref:Helix-turn-helix domain-containing protein n=1 Tax=Bacillus pseudomycoides TaxID=64104 RepID=A0A2A8BYP9_9BACI|nr:hypothetical protein [Bacillus pseudomycoides]PEM65327.1 hypothetical protein CN613_25630 [Bacillus pseudomycoides]